ncbi:MAG TPA: hypothetical protein VGR56_05065 [Nitrososphaerales archaeon]|nr:hypothetical protein [Nitrososphaerales archaeon]
MESLRARSRSPITLVLIVLLVVSLGGLGYFYYNASTLQSLANANASMKVVTWLGSQAAGQSTFEVRITNGNSFDVTLTQLTVSVVDNTGAQVSGNTIASQVVITAGNSRTTEISVAFPDNAAGVNIQAAIQTPYGHVTIGSV